MIRKHKPKALVSACLLGVKCRYDGGHKLTDRVHDLQKRHELVPVCPEQLGGLPTPRPACQIAEGDGHDVLEGRVKVVQVQSGEDATDQFLRGAEATLLLAEFYGAEEAYLKGRSPSCGVGTIVRDGRCVEGNGVAAAMLKRHGVRVHEVD